MVNEDIVTALKNSVDRKESLENAMNILINSGYSPNEVQEASKFIGFSSANQFNPQEQFVMPEEKGFIPKILNRNQNPPVSVNPSLPNIKPILQIPYQTPMPNRPPVQQLPQRIPTNQDIKREISSQPAMVYPAQQQMPGMIPQKPSYKKEIILVIILLILIGALIATLLFKDKILAFFS